LYRIMDATLPKYLKRSFGEDVAFGSIYAINPLLIVFLTPVVQVLLASYPSLKCIVIGVWITSLAPFWLWWSSSLGTSALFVLQLTIGESIWSPRTMDYTMSIIPKGKEGLYMALSGAPHFVFNLFVGTLSGWLLSNHCPSNEICDGNTLWFFIGLFTMVSPILMLVYYFVIHDRHAVEKIESKQNKD